ncbi:hypothetical protein ABZ540_36460 [Nocardia xishanensis]|uniref:hypothetical protein n=1 Tax=Nocardia xishanensis TaxID=238964 RepID=UPI0033D9605D
MLEYKNPTLATVFDIDIHHQDIGVRWSEKQQSITQAPINPMKMEITTSYIDNELEDPDGWRLFHPFSTVWSNRGGPELGLSQNPCDGGEFELLALTEGRDRCHARSWCATNDRPVTDNEQATFGQCHCDIE